MATQLSTTPSGKVQQFFEELEAKKTILAKCTNLFTTLSTHFSSLQHSVTDKSQFLDSKLQSLESLSRETLQSLHRRQTSIPERESASAARISDQKEAAIAELRAPPLPDPDLSTALKSLSRKMDAAALLRFVVSKRKESASLRAEIAEAMAEAVDPPRLVLEAVEEFLRSKAAKSGVTDKRWACGLLIQALMVSESREYSRKIMERAVAVVEMWKEHLDGESDSGAAEVVMFLQMVVCFGLRSRFDDEYLRKFVMEFASRRDMAKLAASLQFGDKIIDIIDELISSGKEIEAVYFASESGLTERFPPINLLKSYHRNYKKNVTTTSKKGNSNHATTDDSSTSELNSIKAIIKCVEDHKLESEFNLDHLRKRATLLEKAKAERKKSSTSGTKPQNKRGNRGNGSSSSRPAKSAKFSNAHSSSFGRRNLAPSLQPSPGARFSGPFNYPNQTIFDGATANPYAATYGTTHTQSPAGITQQHYSIPVDNLGPSGYRSSGSYSGQATYGIYDYRNGAPLTYPPPYTVDQPTYRG
ncbi:FRIGIDA-like protein 4a [Vigna unguiculata]|uniref:FRIGIDA-like protein n=1 Tax=Vigna unguiculata TaxID=3917 RepID=A0A4D6L9S8_VIGUN|nr:FRIGIDA-like protein 4a [Vigna unguiculata]QCD85291.1 Frigida-like [Vigna unguiculata]